MKRVPVLAEAKEVVNRARSGERFDDQYLEQLKSALPATEEGKQLADALHKQQLAALDRDIAEASKQAENGQLIPEFYIDYLRQRARKLSADS